MSFYIPDSRNQILRYIDASGIISTPALTSTDPVWIANGGFGVMWGIAISVDGSTLYVVDEGEEIVWAIDTTSYVVTRVAGGGGSGALGWTFRDIYGVACDSNGNVFVSDPRDQAIVAINRQAVTQTILGVSIAAGDAAYVVAGTTSTGFSGDGGPATAAQVDNPYGVDVDSLGNLYFCDQGNSCIRRVDAATGIINTVVGQGTVSGYSGDGGAPTNATLNRPLGVALDSAGNIYVTDLNNNVIRAVNTQATSQTLCGTVIAPNTIETVAGPTANVTDIMWFCDCDDAGNLGFCNPVRSSPPGGNLWEVTSAGTVNNIAGDGTFGTATGDGGPATSARIGDAFGIAFVRTPALAVVPASFSSATNPPGLPFVNSVWSFSPHIGRWEQTLDITAVGDWTLSSDVPWVSFNGKVGPASLSGIGNAGVIVGLQQIEKYLPESINGVTRPLVGRYSSNLTLTSGSNSVTVPLEFLCGYGDPIQQ